MHWPTHCPTKAVSDRPNAGPFAGTVYKDSIAVAAAKAAAAKKEEL